MKKLLVLFGLMFVIFACSNDCLNMVNECLNGNFSEKNNNENNQGNSNTEGPEKRPTTLQQVVNNANAGEEIDLSDYELTSYTATVNKKLTIKNGSLDNAKLSVKSEGVKLENLTGLSVSASSKLTITDSKLSDLLIGGSGEISRSVTSSAEGALAMVSVTNCKIENVSLDGFNSQLNITDTVTKIEDIVISTKAKIILEAGKYEGMKDPTVKDNGEIARVDMTKKTKLVVLSIYSNPYKLEYNIGDKIDLTGLTVMGTYSTDVETFKSGGWKSEGEDTITKCEDEKDYTPECDLSKAGVSIVTITSKKNPEKKCSFHVFVKESQNTDEEKPEEKIEITDVYLKIFGTAKTTYKVGERLDLSCYQVVGKYNGFEVNLPYTSEPANGAVLETEGENIEIKFHYDGGTLTQTIKVTEPWVVTFKDGNEILYTTEVADGGKLSQLPVAPSKTGYTFAGWYKDDGTKIKAGDSVTSDLELTAQWNANTYTVQFKANNGSGTMTDKTFTYDVEQALTANAFTREDYTFAGWAVKADGTATYADMAKVKNLTSENKATVTLYAVWKVQTTFYVDGTFIGETAIGTAEAPFVTIQDAVNKINEVNDGLAEFTINVQSDINPDTTIYYENNNNALININPDKALNLKICGTKQNTDVTYPTISASGGQQQGRVMYIGNSGTDTKTTVTLENITLANGCYSEGAGVYVGKGSTFNMNSGATISNCTATTDGGGVYVINASTFTMTGGTIQNCEAFLSGGGVWMRNGSSFTMSNDSKIENCTASDNEGGGVFVTSNEDQCTLENSSSFTMSGGTITGCSAEKGGGGVSYGCGTSGTFEISGNAEISNNRNNNSIYGGGGIYLYGKLTMNGGTISGNEASNGAGVYIRHGSSSFTMEDGSISDNKASGKGGGVYLSDSSSSFTMKDGIIGKEITENENDPSKQYSWQYAATGDEGKHSNYAGEGGGGIYAENGTVSIEGGKISYNYVPDPDGNGDPYSTQLKQGGGIFIEGGTLTLKNAEVSYNRGYQGGGVRCSGTDNGFVSELKLDNATIKGNAGKYRGWSNFGGGLVIRNVTNVDFGTTPSIIEENYSADGGAVFIENTTVTLKNITIQNNKYDTDGYRYGSEVLLWDNANVSINESPDNVKIASIEGETQGICIHAEESKEQTNALNLSGNVKLDTPIYLVQQTKINITGDLKEENVATITLDDTFTESTQVLQAGDDITLSEQVGKFAVTSDSSGTSWTISTEGKLKKQE